jgi:hypothetical protein
LLRRRYCIYPVGEVFSITAKLEDGLVHLPHPVMCKYRHVVSVVADKQIRGEAAVDLPSSFCKGLLYLLRSPILSSLSNPSCPLQALDGEGQQEADDLQLEASWRYRVDLLGEQAR